VSAAPPAEADDVAVVGMACRLPGAPDIVSYWRGLVAARDAIRTFDEHALRAAGIDERLLRDPRYVRSQGYLDGIEDFDADLFRIDPCEAARMDPQHRLFLEVAWSALEDAGYDTTLSGGVVGVFAGASENRYLLRNLFGNPAAGEPAAAGPDHLPTRASYALGLTGPSVAVQSACSTSLVAVCLAIQSLRDARCDMAVAGGASLASPGPAGYRFVEGGRRSPDGRCRAFDASAQGSGPATGAGAVVLKRLEDAIANGDSVHAVLKGSAVNNDGADRLGYEAPGVAGQTAVVAEALAAGDVHPDTVGFVEAHGSGTPVGDAIEVEALTLAFRRWTRRTGYCALGSVKTNLGDLDAAGGVAGLIKAVLAVGHGIVPPSLHFERPNPQIDFERSPFFVNAVPLPWERGPAPRRAGISSFGLGGTNAHVVLEEAPGRPGSGPSRPYQVLPLSAWTPAALESAARRLADHLAAHPELPLADVAYTLAIGRRGLGCRAAAVCRDAAGAIRALATCGPGRVAGLESQAGSAPGEAHLMAERWAAGADVDWSGFFRAERRHRVPLPTYPFERRRCWIDPPVPDR
jgi:acyl transferase domain-containing protein